LIIIYVTFKCNDNETKLIDFDAKANRMWVCVDVSVCFICVTSVVVVTSYEEVETNQLFLIKKFRIWSLSVFKWII
jgi:hypothetical protein